MFALGPVGFESPALLWAALALPLLWLLLRAVPPAPLRRRFPATALLLGLRDEDAQAERTPWWLMALRMAALGCLILGLAGPVLHPPATAAGTGPLVVLLDGGWADAPDWADRRARALSVIDEAGAAGRRVAVIRLSDRPAPVALQTADAWRSRLAALDPAPWAPQALAGWVENLPEGRFDSIWFSDGVSREGREDLARALTGRGSLRVIEGDAPVLVLHEALDDSGAVRLEAARRDTEAAAEVVAVARGPDPAGVERELARATLRFAPGAALANASLDDLPPELRNRLTRFEIAGLRSAGAVSLAGDALRRRKVALFQAGPAGEGLRLLSPLHYLRQALAPSADLVEGGVRDILATRPDTVVLADVARLGAPDEAALRSWVEEGGLLLRFAGPRLAQSDLGRSEEDPLLPVRLRAGGREVGGAMSWGEPRGIAPFPDESPFFGLEIPADVRVTRQVLAQPDPDLAERTIAALDDGTPLVTRRRLGKGEVVLFHVTANAEWSNLPLSGLFLRMLERLSVVRASTRPDATDLEGRLWQPQLLLDADGVGHEAGDSAGSVDGAALARALKEGPGPDVPPGIYATAAGQRIALNATTPGTRPVPATWPAGIAVEGLARAEGRPLGGPLLGAALVFLVFDILAALVLSGRARWPGRIASSALIALVFAALPALSARAQEPARPGDDFAIRATEGVVLAYVLTGDPRVDEIARQGLAGLGLALSERTAVEPLAPMGVDIETDELSFFPLLYWPVTADAPAPSGAALEKIDRFLRTGGMILFDTRDAGFSTTGQTPEGAALRRIAAGLDIPPLEPVPADHVLTRSFYLLQQFPGRENGGLPWVEVTAGGIDEATGTVDEASLADRNDGVSPVVIGGNDWAAAWAIDEAGRPLLPVGRGAAGDRQRELALRFGINLVMYALTGNYKSDQVHVPALLERLGQ